MPHTISKKEEEAGRARKYRSFSLRNKISADASTLFFRVSRFEPHSTTSASKIVDVGKVAGRNDGLVESVNCHVTKRTATKRASGTAGESKQRLLSELNTSPTSLIFFPLSGRHWEGRTLSIYTTYAEIGIQERWDKQVISFLITEKQSRYASRSRGRVFLMHLNQIGGSECWDSVEIEHRALPFFLAVLRRKGTALIPFLSSHNITLVEVVKL